jgi:hypothetical protein
MSAETCTEKRSRRHFEERQGTIGLLAAAPPKSTRRWAEATESEGSAGDSIKRFVRVLNAQTTVTYLLCTWSTGETEPFISSGPTLAASTALLAHVAGQHRSIPGRRTQVPCDASAALRDSHRAKAVEAIERALPSLRGRADIEFTLLYHVEGERRVRCDRTSAGPLVWDVLPIAKYIGKRVSTWDRILEP